HRQETRIAAVGARQPRQGGSGENRAGAEQQGAPGRGLEAGAHGDHLRRNSGAINSIVSACGLLSARSIARRVSAEASGPSAVSMIAGGSNRSPTRCAKLLAMSSRWPRPSSQEALSSVKPFGAGG